MFILLRGTTDGADEFTTLFGMSLWFSRQQRKTKTETSRGSWEIRFEIYERSNFEEMFARDSERGKRILFIFFFFFIIYSRNLCVCY